ncbi:MarR family winged helix-turn-helix transcriptional regulator [Streptomyces sp. NBC_01198]|uniref:MarR family winged helix-turn-helix transcriptional regulator n=1 Tax=Streptomyces sp. NBC_01198 TaxID=2903769 RepID=UPI002E15B9A0|nr:MarR family transcriptional regulator [Streptomyces sp. NBC_01198]
MDVDALSTQAAGAEVPPGLAGYAAYLLRRAYALANRLAPDFTGTTEGAGSARDFQVLDALGEPGAAYSQQDLGDRLGINRTTMVKLIDRFEAAGQVTRARNPDDRRSYVLALTEDGRAAVKAMDPAVAAADDKLTAGLTAAERDRLDALLAELLSRPQGGPHRTGSLITQAHHFVRHRIEAALADSALQARHFGALTVLAGAACSQQQLARRLAISEQAVLQVVDDLERAGRVARDRDPQDRRRYALRITEAGRVALRGARGVVEAAEAEMGTALGADGRAELAALLAALLRADS